MYILREVTYVVRGCVCTQGGEDGIRAAKQPQKKRKRWGELDKKRVSKSVDDITSL